MVNATVALIVISWYCQKDGFVNSTVCIAGLIEFSFISFEWGHPPKFTLIKGGGGGHGKKLSTEGRGKATS